MSQVEFSKSKGLDILHLDLMKVHQSTELANFSHCSSTFSVDTHGSTYGLSQLRTVLQDEHEK